MFQAEVCFLWLLDDDGPVAHLKQVGYCNDVGSLVRSRFIATYSKLFYENCVTSLKAGFARGWQDRVHWANINFFCSSLDRTCCLGSNDETMRVTAGSLPEWHGGCNTTGACARR
jgi:hypothetical protein